MAAKRKAMGRGLDILIKDGTSIKKEQESERKDGVQQVPVAQVVSSPWQPRRTFSAEALSELVQSIQEHGVLQPLLVRKANGKYELLAGERRLRAAQAAGLETVPVIVRDADDEKAAEIGLIENLQREDLNPIEEAEGYAQLAREFNLTQEEIARRVGKGRATVTNALRLLELPETIRQAVRTGMISAGHAKVLLGVPDDKTRELLAKRIVKEGLSVRALEKIVRKLFAPPKKPRAEKSDLPSDYLKMLTDELHRYFGTSVRIIPSRTLANGKRLKGSLEIDFHNNEELDRLLTLVGYSKEL